MSPKTIFEWQVIADRVPGASHLRSGLPNQDYHCVFPYPDRIRSRVVLAISDGHGSKRSFRSKTGAEIAAVEARRIGRIIVERDYQPNELTFLKQEIEDRLPRDLASAWKSKVENHLCEFPVTTSMLSDLAEKENSKAAQSLRDNPLIAYGATLLLVLINPSFIAYLQLGDGDILTVNEEGDVSRPLEKDERLFANETTSLCSPNAWKDFRTHFQVLIDKPPALILASTDGYSNSFQEEAGFLKVGTDFLALLRRYKPFHVRVRLKKWLTEASKLGSGDDVTLGLIFRLDALNHDAARIDRELLPTEAGDCPQEN